MTVSATGSLAGFLEASRSRIDARDGPLPSAAAGMPAPPVSEAMRYSLLAGGKRLRPVLVLAAADAVARRTGADARRPRVAGRMRRRVHPHLLPDSRRPARHGRRHACGAAGPRFTRVYGDGIAILAGDALQAEAFALVAREPDTPDPATAERKLRALAVLAEAAGASGMVGGQTVDLQAAGQVPGQTLTLTPDSLKRMHLQKTGALIQASAVCGALMAGAHGAQREAIERWGTEVGLAFQIVDDILDVEGDAAALGKTAGKDAAGDKPTYPALFGLEQSRSMAAACAGRAHEALVHGALTDGWLDAIAEWVISRRN